jgi:hypothetical protein
LQKERGPINIKVGQNSIKERNSQMTDDAVDISITIKVNKEEMEFAMEFAKEEKIMGIEEATHCLMTEIGQQVIRAGQI